MTSLNNSKHKCCVLELNYLARGHSSANPNQLSNEGDRHVVQNHYNDKNCLQLAVCLLWWRCLLCQPLLHYTLQKGKQLDYFWMNGVVLETVELKYYNKYNINITTNLLICLMDHQLENQLKQPHGSRW